MYETVLEPNVQELANGTGGAHLCLSKFLKEGTLVNLETSVLKGPFQLTRV